MAEQKIRVGERVLLPNGIEAVVREATNFHQKGYENEPDEWQYHVSYPSSGLGGRLNFREDELKVWRETKPGTFTPQKP